MGAGDTEAVGQGPWTSMGLGNREPGTGAAGSERPSPGEAQPAGRTKGVKACHTAGFFLPQVEGSGTSLLGSQDRGRPVHIRLSRLPSWLQTHLLHGTRPLPCVIQMLKNQTEVWAPVSRKDPKGRRESSPKRTAGSKWLFRGEKFRKECPVL